MYSFKLKLYNMENNLIWTIFSHAYNPNIKACYLYMYQKVQVAPVYINTQIGMKYEEIWLN